jgi:signal transduction histidine kinase/CheY-like chemotaxis protein
LTALARIGLRQLLIALSLAGIVPLAIVATVLLVALWRTQQAQLHDSTRATAHAMSASVEQRIDSTVRRLRFLGTMAAPENVEALHRRSNDILASSPDWSSIVLIAPDGENVFSLGARPGASLPQSADPPHRKKVFEGEVSVSDLLLDPRNIPVVEIGVPLLRDGKVAYGLFATLEGRELSELLRSQLRDSSGVAGIADGEYRIVARTGDPANFIGKPLATPLDRAVRASPSGVGRFPVYDGADVFSAWSRIGGTGWTLILATPASRADAALSRSLGAFAALLVIVLVASSLFAWLIGRRLAGAIHAAAGAAVDMSVGRPAAGPPSRIDEVRTLMDALERSSTRLAAAEAERQLAEAERDRMLEAERRARQQAESASRAKDEFLAMLGHELRNPLGAIGNAVRVIDRLPSSSGDHKAARDIIARQTAHLAKIVDDLLDVGRVVSGRILLRRNLVDLAQATATAVATVRAGERGTEHEWQLELATVLVSADPTRVDQILANLLGNAAKFTPAGGRIGVRLHEEDGEAVLAIEDSGPGIRPELMAQIFDLFAKDMSGPERGGLGLGLTLVRRLVELHGGRVDAENVVPGHGARFTLRMPSIPEPEPVVERGTRALPSPRPSRQARVLIVEDNDDARVTLQRILQADGHLVSAARDGRTGLEAAIAGSPTIAVVDIGLPGMDGYQFARAMRERLGSGVRLIALTGYGTENDRQRAADAGFDAHLTKPVDLDRLLALITEAGS